MDIAKDFVEVYMKLLPEDPAVNRFAHKTLAITIGSALAFVLTKYEHERRNAESQDSSAR